MQHSRNILLKVYETRHELRKNILKIVGKPESTHDIMGSVLLLVGRNIKFNALTFFEPLDFVQEVIINLLIMAQPVIEKIL